MCRSMYMKGINSSSYLGAKKVKGILFVIDLVKRVWLASDDNIKFKTKADPGALKPRISGL